MSLKEFDITALAKINLLFIFLITLIFIILTTYLFFEKELKSDINSSLIKLTDLSNFAYSKSIFETEDFFINSNTKPYYLDFIYEN